MYSSHYLLPQNPYQNPNQNSHTPSPQQQNAQLACFPAGGMPVEQNIYPMPTAPQGYHHLSVVPVVGFYPAQVFPPQACWPAPGAPASGYYGVVSANSLYATGGAPQNFNGGSLNGETPPQHPMYQDNRYLEKPKPQPWKKTAWAVLSATALFWAGLFVYEAVVGAQTGNDDLIVGGILLSIFCGGMAGYAGRCSQAQHRLAFAENADYNPPNLPLRWLLGVALLLLLGVVLNDALANTARYAFSAPEGSKLTEAFACSVS